MRDLSIIYWINTDSTATMSETPKKAFNVLLSQSRSQRLKGYAASKDKTMAEVFRDWVDTLPNPPKEQE